MLLFTCKLSRYGGVYAPQCTAALNALNALSALPAGLLDDGRPSFFLFFRQVQSRGAVRAHRVQQRDHLEGEVCGNERGPALVQVGGTMGFRLLKTPGGGWADAVAVEWGGRVGE